MTESEWNDAIGAWFFTPLMAGRPVYLCVDEDSLREIALHQGWTHLSDPVGHFEQAVRMYISPMATDPFRPWRARCTTWERKPLEDRGSPPFLALLGATVLAATRGAHTSFGRHGSGYYGPLRELLGLPAGAMPRGFDEHIPYLWRRLNKWLTDLDGRLGLPTASAPLDYWPYIGWSMSQAILRGGDRARLTDFFQAIGAEPGTDLDLPELCTRFRKWGRSSGRISDRLLRLCDDEDTREVVGHILANELRSWDGSLRDERGRRVARLLIRLDERTRELGFVAAVPRGLGATEVEAAGMRIRLEEGSRYVLTGLTIAAVPLESDWVVTTDRVKLRYDYRPVVPFRPNDDVGGWTSVQQGELGETHYVLVDDRQLDAVRKFFEGYLSQPALMARRVQLPAGWTLFKSVRLEVTYAEVPDALLPLLPKAETLPELVGGLRVSSHSPIYLDDGAPDLLVPGLDQPLDVTIDGRVIEAVGRAGSLITLADLQLAQGSHEVMVGSTRLRFELRHEFAEEPPPPLFAHHLDWAGPRLRPDEPARRFDPDAAVAVSGAAIMSHGIKRLEELAAPPRMVKPSTCGYLALGPPGHAALIEASAPAWATAIGLGFHAFELDAYTEHLGFPVIWLVRLFRYHATVTLVNKPIDGLLTASADEHGWREQLSRVLSLPKVIVMGDDDTARLWAEYCGQGAAA